MKLSLIAFLGLLLFIITTFSRCGGGHTGVIDTVATPITPAIARIGMDDRYYRQKVALKTKLFYGANALKRAWLKPRKPGPLYHALLEEIHHSRHYGMDPADYHIKEIETEVKKLYADGKPESEKVSNLDIQITTAFFLYTTHLIEGRIRYPGAKEFLWKRGKPLENDIVLLLKMKSADDLHDVMEDLQPKNRQYKLLQKALAQYQTLAKGDTFPALPSGVVVKPGESAAVVSVLRKKLSLTDYSGEAPDSSSLYDPNLVKAVKKFQRRNGLTPDGIVAGETIAALNVPLAAKAALIALNLERMRWYPHLEGNHNEIIINIPEYMLRVYRDGKEKLNMRVVLGSEYKPTPVFYDTLKYIVFNPQWMVPESIFKEEFLPRLAEDGSFFDPARFRFYKDGKEIDPAEEKWDDKELDTTRYRVIENPGDENSLGQVKFIMPNDFSIYLHDTPAVQLFREKNRAFSHGCIRIEKPVALAAYLLSDQKEWNEKKIRAAMDSNEPLKVDLQRTFRIYIIYRTAWVDRHGDVNFRDDLYGHDRRQLARLK